MRPQRAPDTKVRTREDRAIALNMLLVGPSDAAVCRLIGDHSLESFAKSRNLPANMIRNCFEHAAKRRAARDNLL